MVDQKVINAKEKKVTAQLLRKEIRLEGQGRGEQVKTGKGPAGNGSSP